MVFHSHLIRPHPPKQRFIIQLNCVLKLRHVLFIFQLTYFTHFSNVSIVDFEQVNVSWVLYLLGILLWKYLNKSANKTVTLCGTVQFKKLNHCMDVYYLVNFHKKRKRNCGEVKFYSKMVFYNLGVFKTLPNI